MATSVPDEPIVGLTPAQAELIPVSHPVIERGSGSTSVGLSPANDIMVELARQMVQHFFCFHEVMYRLGPFWGQFLRIRPDAS